MRKIDRIKVVLGLILLLLGIMAMKRQGIQEEANSFATEPVHAVDLTSKSATDNQIPNRIVIQNVSIDLPVRKAVVRNGYWEVFPDVAGWGEGSEIPGDKGNIVIFAHAKKGLFYNLNKVHVEDRIDIYTDEQVLPYTVKDIKTVYPQQTEVIEPTEDETLTLYTCSGFNDTKRLIVVAKRT